jgi:hypothetical protein
LSWLEDNQQQPVPTIIIADGGEQQQLGLIVSLSFSGKMPRRIEIGLEIPQFSCF